MRTAIADNECAYIRPDSYGLWSKLLCKLSSLSDLKNLPQVWHTKGWDILARGFALSPLSVVGPMLDADILLITHLGPVLDLSVTNKFLDRRYCFYNKWDPRFKIHWSIVVFL
jgi:hypothetical protein